ncbi:DUF3618 domain-containing protein [Herbiconiux sp. CPCC 205763]|uniref:DUF3618 domain-containing protein n=1 Tax=Herbiconiux aconitum TaxID=2970913 RepID=A0ABT2GPF6_9MICO|nr:DUF3618 domain-containing protein [Herbiconiux aconitum]MCS5717482.1 DUF3618 domain-containing protein [Herbiconiux aconitum]
MSDKDATPELPQRSKEQLHADIEKNRARLKATLDAIEFKLNVPKQARHAVHRVKTRIAVFRDRNPIGFGVGVASAIAAVGLVAVLGFRSASKK